MQRILQMIKNLEERCAEIGYISACQLIVHNEVIACKDKCRYLGIIRNNRLKWITHVKQQL